MNFPISDLIVLIREELNEIELFPIALISVYKVKEAV